MLKALSNRHGNVRRLRESTFARKRQNTETAPYHIKSSILSLKYSDLGANIGKIYKRADWPPPGYDAGKMFDNLWLIKNPILRAVRLKVVYKDIFSNERRFRFQLSVTPNCDICGSVETVEHHLFLCTNASRIWDLYSRLTGLRINSLFDLIHSDRILENEIIKSVLLKALIQINRSRDSMDRAIISECIFFLSTEARTNVTQSEKLKQTIYRISRSI